MLHYKHWVCCAFFFLFHTMGYAQEADIVKTRRSQFLLSINNGIAFNKFNVINNEINPNPVAVPKATTYKPSISFDYQRITSYNLIYGFGIQFGTYNHDVDINYPDLTFLDTMKELESQSYYFKFRNSTGYAALRLFVGYSFALDKKAMYPSYLDVKLGITKRIYFSGGSSEKYLYTNVISNDTIFANYKVSYISDDWGWAQNNSPNFIEYYIGFRKTLRWHFVSDLNIGVFGTYQFEVPGAISKEGAAETSVRSLMSLHNVYQSSDWDYYYNRELTFGIKVGAGLKF